MELVQLHSKKFKKFISYTQIKNSIDKLILRINKDYAQKTPVFIGVLNGSFLFCADLIKEYDGDCEVAFVRVASYQGTQTSGSVENIMGLTIDLKGRDVIIIEDIVDTGNTLENLMNTISKQYPSSIKIATLFFIFTHPLLLFQLYILILLYEIFYLYLGNLRNH